MPADPAPEEKILPGDSPLHDPEQRIRELESDLARMQEFTSVAGHDLKVPLRKIVSYADALKSREPLSAQGADYVDRIIHATEKMRQLLNDLLQYFLLQPAGDHRQYCSIQEILDSVLKTLEVTILEKGARIQVAEPLPIASVVPFQIELLFQNLIVNALKFCRPGIPPLIHISHAITSTHQPLADRLQICLEDNGIGFANDYAEAVFSPLQRLHGPHYEGSGMGLAICRRILQNHGGSIAAHSEPGKGTTFTIILPLEKPPVIANS